ncbi:site-specific DNA-methyltransferase [Treponema zuelzerae]|uniref:site-specific DNA-methyltransferase (adenine-specific) n=1 Tax=Teretinema zuelzerae TaxID=156 RepID=A0AAE3JKE4_9SPIR|nr:site-specific DNA-methyltransferase [Teretinema zuelzerae]MCD1655180.1 site-specific DNA-methyltransferase [Teretinema zuelzerae]
MPTLNWIGKDKVINHHLDVPFRTLVPSYSFGDAEATKDNLIIHGDNLEALKALLPQYEGKVKLIYIDPPYNTGNEGWVYNDNVNDPKIKKWLGEVVGKEGEDLSRHDKWLCMMYPRLKLLQKLLREDGAISISIDDVEHAHLKLICDEIFGINNFLANIVWQSKDTPGNNSSGIAETHNHILLYRKSELCELTLLTRDEKQLSTYINPDNDPRGNWLPTPLTRVEYRERDFYTIKNKVGDSVYPPQGSSWRRPPDEMKRLENENRIWWGKSGDAKFPMEKKFLSEVKQGVVNQTWWPYNFGGSTRNASAELKLLFGGNKAFETPKPIQLATRIIQLLDDPDSIILDSFSGSGTTAHAVLKLNQEDGGHRKFIMIEMEDYAETITAERVRRVINGYGAEGKEVPGTGGGFSYLTLGPAVFTAEGALNPEVEDEALRQYIWYAETKSALPAKKLKNKFHLGSAFGVSYYFYYIKGQETVLDFDFLKTVRDKDEQYVIYADSCTIDSEYLKSRNITFKKIPRDISRY